MNDLKQKEPGDYCNARKTDGSGYCRQPAGWGTDHDVGRCKFHGGNTPTQEKGIIDDLEDASGHAAVALKLRLKHASQKAEEGAFEDIDWGEIDRHARTVLDRADHGPTETHEHTGENGGPLMILETDGDDTA